MVMIIELDINDNVFMMITMKTVETIISTGQFNLIHTDIIIINHSQRGKCLGNGGTDPGCEDGSWFVSDFMFYSQ